MEAPPVFTDVQPLVDELTRRTARIIGIDGHDGSGKSFLGQQLGAALGATVLELDRFLAKRRAGAYLRHLDLDRLAEGVERCSGRPLIIEGVCLLAALERAGISADLIVYVRRLSANFGHLWHDDVYHEKREHEFDSPLHREIRQYNLLYLPLSRADFFFDRIESPPD